LQSSLRPGQAGEGHQQPQAYAPSGIKNFSGVNVKNENYLDSQSQENTSEPVISKVECEGLWKVFGVRSEEAIAAMQQGRVDRDKIREQFDCVPAVIDVNLSVASGEIFCIMGLSGSGKSTIVRHINRLIEPSRGQVYVDGEDIGKLKPDALRHLRATQIGMVFQDRGLLPHRNVRDNVAFALELRRVKQERRDEIAEQVLDLVQLTGWGDLMPDELSGGMQQRVGLARALAANPDILLMDEPFGALDPLIRRELQDQFLQLSANLSKTTIFITHDLDEAIRLGTRIAIMKDGEIVQTGTPEDIITSPKDDYVEDFVRNISRLEVVKAHSVMSPVEEYDGEDGKPLNSLAYASPETNLGELIDIIIKRSGAIAIIDDGKPIGVVTLASLLKGIRGSELEKVANND